jgi:hypothetical protein
MEVTPSRVSVGVVRLTVPDLVSLAVGRDSLVGVGLDEIEAELGSVRAGRPCRGTLRSAYDWRDVPSHGQEANVPTKIELPELRELIAAGAQLVDMLPPEDFAEYHLPGAINLPLRTLDAMRAAALDRARPVIVYCHDAL